MYWFLDSVATPPVTFDPNISRISNEYNGLDKLNVGNSNGLPLNMFFLVYQFHTESSLSKKIFVFVHPKGLVKIIHVSTNFTKSLCYEESTSQGSTVSKRQKSDCIN